MTSLSFWLLTRSTLVLIPLALIATATLAACASTEFQPIAFGNSQSREPIRQRVDTAQSFATWPAQVAHPSCAGPAASIPELTFKGPTNLTDPTPRPVVTLGMNTVLHLPVAEKSRRIVVSERASKIEQLVGDYDAERNQRTRNQTGSRYHVLGTDLGVPFQHKGRTYLLFGDTVGGPGGDVLAYTSDMNIDKGVCLEFLQSSSGGFKPIRIPGIDQGDYAVPVEGVSVGGAMYVYHTTDSELGPAGPIMGRSIVAVSHDDGNSFTYLYDLSRARFINVSIVQIQALPNRGWPMAAGSGLAIFGSGSFRKSNVSLAFQPASGIGVPHSLLYWSGSDSRGAPQWSKREKDARALFSQPCVGEQSVSYNIFIRKWIMLYNCDLAQSRGINMRTADEAWGPWSEPQIIFRPWEDGGYCHFMHASWQFSVCDDVQIAGKEEEWGGEYGPFQFENMATGDAVSTTIYFTMSTWNPYTVVLMRARLSASP